MPITIPTELAGLRPLRDGFSPVPEGALESRVDDGPPKTRRVSTLVMEQTPVTFRMTAAVYRDYFKPFYETTLKRGSLWFDWTEPLSGVTVQAQFVSASPPAPTKRPGGRIHVAATLRIKR